MIFYYCPIRGLQYNYQNPLYFPTNFVPSPSDIEQLVGYCNRLGISIFDSQRWEKEIIEINIWSNL